MTRTWLVYIRKSVVRNDTDLESPERQLSNCKKRLEITETEPYEVEVYQDLDRSGIKEEGREDWLRLKGRLGDPDVIGVIGNSLDRLYRNVYEFLAFLSELEKNGKVLVTAKEFLDTGNPLGRFVVTILMAMYEMESRLTSVRMRDMIEDKRRDQGRHWGGAPFGCDRDEKTGQLIPTQKTYTIEEETRYFYDALTECFKLYAGGNLSYEQVANLLNVAGWRFCDRYNETGEWNEDRVRGVVGRWRLYQGQLPMGNPIKNRTVEYVEGGHQPILPVELCQAASVVLASRTRQWWPHPGAARRVYLLSDFSYCGQCGIKLIGQFDSWSNHRVYRHKSSKGECPEKWINAQGLEETFITAITELDQYPQVLAGIRAKLTKAISIASHDEDNSRNQVEEVNGRLERLNDAYINEGAITKDDYLRRRTELLSRLASLQPQEIEAESVNPVEEVMAYLYSIESAADTTKKAFLSNLVERLEVMNGTVRRLAFAGWAKPFFSAYSQWAGWESNPTDTKPAILSWLNNEVEV